VGDFKANDDEFVKTLCASLDEKYGKGKKDKEVWPQEENWSWYSEGRYIWLKHDLKTSSIELTYRDIEIAWPAEEQIKKEKEEERRREVQKLGL
jgi:hypothetical protein